MSNIANNLPNDILLIVFGVLQDDYNNLFRSALVNRAFNLASSKYLYRHVVLAPTYRLILSLKGVDPILVRISNNSNRKPSSRILNQGKLESDLGNPSSICRVCRNC